jgi:hypothetical protein
MATNNDISLPLGTQAIPLGGPGSGHWAHVGRLGKRGGSAPGGGLGKINANRKDPVEVRRKLSRVAQQKGAMGNKNEKGVGVTTKAFGNNPNTHYDFQYQVVPLASLVPSNTLTGAVNPDYTRELQPRDRSRTASQAQIDEMAKGLAPEALLWDFHALDKGAPIVGDDLMVESGNGRTLALLRAKELYPEKFTQYQRELAKLARDYGINEDDLKQIEDGVLVRVRKSDVDRAKFAQEANAPTVLQMSPLEQAAVDAAKVKLDWLNRFEVKDGQSIDEALRAAGNREFVRKFVGELTTNERATVMRGDGTLNRMGLWRIKAAIFSKVFPGEAGQRLADTFLESLDSGIKNFEAAIGDIMPKLAQAESLIASGQRDRSLSLAGDISKAIDMLARLRENGMPVNVYTHQASLFDRETTPTQDRILTAFDGMGRSRKQIRTALERYADAVINGADPRQGSLFGGMALTKDGLINLIIEGAQ